VGLHIIRTAIDTLEVSFYGAISEDQERRLDSLKLAARDTPRSHLVGLFELMVMPSAFGRWTWMLRHPEFQITIRRRAPKGAASASVRLTAFGLANQDPAMLFDMVRLTMERLGSFKVLKVSRADVCVDSQGWEPTPSEMRNIVCSAAYRATHGIESQVQTYQYGKGAVVFRLYNKTAEIVESGKDWMRDAWRCANGFDPSEPVWRAEVQLRRAALDDLGVNHPEQVFADPRALLDFGLRWAQMRVPSADATKTRWPEDPRWTRLREEVYSGIPLKRHTIPGQLMSLERTVSQLIGAVATAGAYYGIREYLGAAQALSFAAEAHMMQEKIDFAALVEEKRRRIQADAQ